MSAIGFGVLAACTLLSAIFVVRAKDLVHAVLWLGATLLATAALYAAMGASFLAGVQALVYVGGVITLMIFGVMITRKHETGGANAESRGTFMGALVAVLFFGLVAAAIRATPGLDAAPQPEIANAGALGRSLLQEHVLAFEVVSLLLLAAIVGALVIARRKDPAKAEARARVAKEEPAE